MMGRLKSDQGQLFYEFHLGDAVPEDHLVRQIDTALDLSWVRGELAPHYSSIGRPSIDPELMIRGRLRLRGPHGAQDEFVLAAIAQNLRRLASLVARPPPAQVLCMPERGGCGKSVTA